MTDGIAPDIRIVSKGATPLEIAAVTAVLTATLEELSAAQSAEAAPESAWMRTRRPLRKPLERGPGAWRCG